MEQRKRESQIPKGTFGGPPVEDASLRGDLSGTFIRPVSEIAPAPIAKIELRRQVACPPPPPSGPRRSLLPPPPPPPAVSSEPSLRALVAPSYPVPAPIVAEPERVEFPDYSLRLEFHPIAPAPASLLPAPGQERPRSFKALGLVALVMVIAVASWFATDLIPSVTPSVVKPSVRKSISVPASPVVSEVVASPIAAIEPAAPTEAVVAAPVVDAVPTLVVAPTVPVALNAKLVVHVEPVVASPVAAESAVIDSEDSAEHAPSLEVALVEEIPETLERAEVIEGIEILRNEYEACAGELHGMAELKLTIANTGRISHALVDGDFAGTPEGSCLARTLRQARFRTFLQPRLDIAYPLSL